MFLAYDLNPEFFIFFFLSVSLKSLRYFQQIQFPVPLCLFVLLSQSPLSCQNVGHILRCTLF